MYLVAAVVMAALLPLALPAVGVPVGPGVISAEAANPTAASRRAAALPKPEAAVVRVESAPSSEREHLEDDVAVAWVEPPAAPVDEPLIVIDDDENEGESVERASGRKVRSRRVRLPPSARAKAACRKGDKKSARTAYRLIPFGDERRREIRRACRRQGIWIL